jgi:DUF1016 N-terminal domain
MRWEASSRKSPDAGISGTLSRNSAVEVLGGRFFLPWSHYVLLVRRTRSPEARSFYQTEALRGGWSVRQLDRQIASRFYERTALSQNKAAMLTRGARPQPEDRGDADGEIRDPLPSKVLAREYRVALPDEKRLAAEIARTRELLEAHAQNPIVR